VFLGWDPREVVANRAAEYSLLRHAARHPVSAEHISIETLPEYDRPMHQMPNGQLYDEISDAPMSTSHAIARFWVPRVCAFTGWAVFTDGDVLFRADVNRLFALADPQYAVMVVQHGALPEQASKKGGHIQQAYPRKNWSSVILWNCGHLANRALTREVLNRWPGRDLHAFKWLREDQIGALPATWNHLVNVSAPDPDPAIVHYTLGTPDVPGHEHDAFADDWLRAARVGGYSLPVSFHTELVR
jgi:lipopolysaccharide biosynthesis glycosyltransferase